MASPERPQFNTPQFTTSQSSGEGDLQEQIEELQRKLEIVDSNENTIERTGQRETLLEQLDLLQDERGQSGQSNFINNGATESRSENE